jgi:site-specific recombinase XerD
MLAGCGTDNGSVRRFSKALDTVRKRVIIRTVSALEMAVHMASMVLKLAAPATQNRTVDNAPAAPPLRRKNSELRTREYLTTAEVEKLMTAAKANRWGHRDATMIMLAYRHGLRASELVDLRWDQVSFDQAALHVRRVKNGSPATHPIQGDVLRALRRLQRESPASPFVFVSERGSPFSSAGFAKLIERAGVAAKLGFKAHPHMLRHACGYKLANDGVDTRALQAYLGHKNIQHTVRYTELSLTRFKDFWRK